MTTASDPHAALTEDGGTQQGTSPRRWGWRSWLAVATWSAVVVGFFVLLATFGQVFAAAVGQALGAEIDGDDLAPLYWTFVWIALAMGVATVAAIIARRWVALVLAVLFFGGSGLLAIGLYPSVQPIVAPVEHVDHGPLPCACYSGSPCDCPGG